VEAGRLSFEVGEGRLKVRSDQEESGIGETRAKIRDACGLRGEVEPAFSGELADATGKECA
jgi:hypothetical protein